MKNISIVIPAYNEEQRLQIVFEALIKTWPKNYSLKEVIFVNDGSADNTERVLLSKQKKLQHKLKVPVKLVSYPVNRGKGYAVKRGLLEASGEWVLLVDVDMSTPFVELNKFELKVKSGAKVIVGTRKNGHSTVVVPQPLYRQFMGKVFTYLTQFTLGMGVTDFTCGFKLINKVVYRDIAQYMSVERWGYDAEILYLAYKYGFDVIEVPVAWYNDQRTKVNLIKDVARSFVDLLQIRVNDMNSRYERETTRANLDTGVVLWNRET